MVKVTSLLNKVGSGVGCIFGVRAWTEMEIQCSLCYWDAVPLLKHCGIVI